MPGALHHTDTLIWDQVNIENAFSTWQQMQVINVDSIFSPSSKNGHRCEKAALSVRKVSWEILSCVQMTPSGK